MIITVKKRPVKDLFHIYINVHDGGKYPKERPSTGVKINKIHWNKKGNKEKKNWVSTKDKEHKEKNQQIYLKLIEVEAEQNGVTTQTHTKKNEDVKGGRKSYVNYAKERMELRRNLNSKDVDTYALKKFEKYLVHTDNVGLQLKEINQKFVKLYYNWLLKNVATSTANTYMNNFQAVYNSAINDDTLNFTNNSDPFKGLEREKDHTKNRSLSQTEFDKFKNAKIPPHKLGWLEAHDIFMYQFWGAFRNIDVMCTKWGHFKVKDNEILIDFVTIKGKGERVVRVVPYSIINLLKPYITRYYPELTKELQPLELELKNIVKQVKKVSAFPVIDSIDDVMKLLKDGYSQKEIEYMRNHQMTKEETESLKAGDVTTKMPHHTTLVIQHKNLLHFIQKKVKSKFKKLIESVPDEYVFNTPNKVNWEHPDKWSEEDKKRFKVVATTNWRYLKEISIFVGLNFNVHSHVSRHTATQFLLDSGASHHATSEYLTHSNLATLEKYRARLGKSNDTLNDNLSKYLK